MSYPYPEPEAIKWFRVYCGFMAALYLLCIVIGVAAFTFAPQLADIENPEAEFRFIGALVSVLGVVFGAAFILPFLLQRQRWVWTYSLVLICLGFSSCLTWIPCIFLLLAWLRPEVEGRFGRGR